MELLIALFAIAAMVWMIPAIQRGGLMVVVLLVLGMGTVFGPSFLSIDGPVQLSLDRLLFLAAIGLAIAGWRLGYTRVPQPNRLDWLVIAVVVWFLIRVFPLGDDPDAEGGSPLARWLFYIACPALMYGLARVIEIREREIRWMLAGSILLGLYLAVMAILEIRGWHGVVFPAFITDPEIWEFFGRGRGPLLNPAGNGFVMSISLLAALLGFVYAGRRGKLLYAIVSLVLLGGIYATLTRCAWMGAGGAVALVGLVYAPRWVRLLGLASVVMLAGVSIAGFKDQLIRMKRDKNLAAADAEKSIQLRPLLAVVAWEMFKDHPLTGHGYGHYPETKVPYHSNRSYALPLEQARPYVQHNVLLSVLVDTGLIGLSLFGGWLLTLSGIGWGLARQRSAHRETCELGMLLLGAIMAYLCNGMFHDVMIIPMVHMFLFFIAGVAVTVHQRGLAAATAPAGTPEKSAAERRLCLSNAFAPGP
jgi:O-antigen ligase